MKMFVKKHTLWQKRLIFFTICDGITKTTCILLGLYAICNVKRNDVFNVVFMH